MCVFAYLCECVRAECVCLCDCVCACVCVHAHVCAAFVRMGVQRSCACVCVRARMCSVRAQRVVTEEVSFHADEANIKHYLAIHNRD